MPEPSVSDRVAIAREALNEITRPADVGELLSDTVGDDGVITVLFATTDPGYPGWRWTVSLVQLEGDEPTVLEAELLPGEGALVAPEWVPWSTRLEEWRAQQGADGEADAALAEGADGEDDDSEEGDSEDEDDDLDDELDESDDELDETDDDLDDDESDDDGEDDLGDDVYDGLDPEAALETDDGADGEDPDDEDPDDEDDADDWDDDEEPASDAR